MGDKRKKWREGNKKDLEMEAKEEKMQGEIREILWRDVELFKIFLFVFYLIFIPFFIS